MTAVDADEVSGWSALVDSNHRSSACRATALAAELRAVHSVWSGGEDSHPRSTAYQTAALAAELPPDFGGGPWRIRTAVSGLSNRRPEPPRRTCRGRVAGYRSRIAGLMRSRSRLGATQSCW